MKKFALPMGVITALVIAVLFALNSGRDKNTEPTLVENTEVVVALPEPTNDEESSAEENQEKIQKKNKVNEIIKASADPKNLSEEFIENIVTGENVPEGYYDEVLVDGYTFNNPKPLPEEWITETAGEDYPATIDWKMVYNQLPESYILPGKIYSSTNIIPEYMYGHSKRVITIDLRKASLNFSDKTKFTEWLNTHYGYKFYFIEYIKGYNTNKGIWQILITEGEIDDLIQFKSDLVNSYSATTEYDTVDHPKYRGTEELERLNKAASNSKLFKIRKD